MEADTRGAQGILQLVDGRLQVTLEVQGLAAIAMGGGLAAGLEGGIGHELIEGGAPLLEPHGTLQGGQGPLGLAGGNEGLGVGRAQGLIVRI